MVGRSCDRPNATQLRIILKVSAWSAQIREERAVYKKLYPEDPQASVDYSSHQLWQTIDGAPKLLLAVWGSFVAAAVAHYYIGISDSWHDLGVVVVILYAGRLCARFYPAPTECFWRYHLDEEGLRRFGRIRPWVEVKWDDVLAIHETEREMVLELYGLTLRLPRTVPGYETWRYRAISKIFDRLAADIWEQVSTGHQVGLKVETRPRGRDLAWWTLPSLIAVLGSGCAWLLAVLCVVSMAERCYAGCRSDSSQVVLGINGVCIQTRWWSSSATWLVYHEIDCASVAPDTMLVKERVSRGLLFLLTPALANYWPARAVVFARAGLAKGGRLDSAEVDGFVMDPRSGNSKIVVAEPLLH